MEEEARDWCLLKEAEWYISARSKSRVMDFEDVVIDNLTKEEAIAFLSSVGKAGMSKSDGTVFCICGGVKK